MCIGKQQFAVWCGVVFGAALSGQAAIIFSNPYDGVINSGASNPYTVGNVVAPNLITGGVTRNAVVGTTATGSFTTQNWGTGTGIDITRSLSFVLTPAAGYQINLNSFTFEVLRSSSGPRLVTVRSAFGAGSFGGNLITPVDPGLTAQTVTVPLSGAEYQGLTSMTTFRLYGYSASAINGTLSLNNFAFNGEVVAIPEPAMLGLPGVAAVALLRRRRA